MRIALNATCVDCYGCPLFNYMKDGTRACGYDFQQAEYDTVEKLCIVKLPCQIRPCKCDAERYK